HFEFVDRSTRKQVPKCFDSLEHFLAQFFLGNFLHCTRDELKIGVERNIEFDLVPNVRKKRPRIIVNDLVEYFLIRKLDQTTTGVISGKILPSKFPECGVEIPHIDNIARGFADLYAIAYSERLADKNVHPRYEALDRCLHSKTDDH